MPNDMTLAFADARRGTLDCRPAPVCDPRPVCPACGGLECLCRPRFFAGQLLSEEDLNRLDHYIVAKNRLHNRHLFGTGVVCGLEVICSTCDPVGNGNVVVRPGYALSPCGNDIVVCRDETVDVCDLINRCRPRSNDCFEPGPDRDRSDEDDEQWVLAICYQETQSRGITALRGSSCGCAGSCGCGGHKAPATGASTTYTSEASCGCGGGTAARTATGRSAAKPGPVPPQCEPTLTCEGYTFAVYKEQPEKDGRRVDAGALIRRFICCFQPLLEQLTKLPAQNATPDARQDWLISLVTTLREFLIVEGLYDCDIAARLSAVALPSRGEPANTYLTKWSSATLAVIAIIAAIFQKCLCAALLPPCPPPEMNDCVPIATLTVARGRCRVRHICNIGSRRFVLTFPSIQYWLSWLPPLAAPKGQTLADHIEGICCTPISDLFDFRDAGKINLSRPQAAPARARRAAAGIGAVAEPEAGAGAAAGERQHPFTALLAESLVAGGQQTNAATLLLAALGARNPDGSALASEIALEYPGEAMLIHQVLAPAIAPLLPVIGVAGGASKAVDALADEVAKLKVTVKKQQNDIAKLRRR
jgi:hypothetical protein